MTNEDDIIERERQVAEDIKIILRAFAEEMTEEDEEGKREAATTIPCVPPAQNELR